MNLDTKGFSLGDKVFGRNTGGSEPSTIIGFIPSFMSQHYEQISKWDELYPSWREGLIAICKFNIPQRVCTLEEFADGLPDDNKVVQAIKSSEELLKDYYETKVQPQKHVSYPIEDLM